MKSPGVLALLAALSGPAQALDGRWEGQARLGGRDQAVVREVMGRVYKEFDAQNRLDNQAALKSLQQQGLILVDPLPGEEKRWREIAATVNARVGRDGTFTPGLYDQLQQILAQYRSAGGKGK